MTLKQIVDQIIELKVKHNLIEDDATYGKMFDWYVWALQNGHCDVVIKDDKVVGFLEWVRLKDIPKSAKDFDLDHSVMDTAPIAFVGNSVADNLKTLLRLKRLAMKKQADAEYFVWHSKRRNKMKVFRCRK